MAISDPGRGLVRRLGVTAAALLAFAAASQQRAEALSLASPGTAPAAKFATEDLTTEVRGGHGGGGGFRGGGGGGFRGGGGGFRGGGFHGGGFRGGGAAFHGGGFRGGGFAVHRGGFRAAPVFRGGGMRHGYRHVYHRPHFHHRHHFHRRYYAPRYYGYPGYHYGYRHRYCRVIWTYYGPRKICRYRPWYRHHYRVRYYGSPYRYW
ncbi:hypothetical protein [Bradyrhizobium roseum]|uniref:hypothetical protein n=1 Tax=Bradyrhizobium roseum TaxID=3056648 RepID=UPI0026373037|nr:hypothetical protein [Bradyrhizobium roseus]WKA28954.1 hypothetical protein QUH67_01770 [Bradyrhizobium roseus]